MGLDHGIMEAVQRLSGLGGAVDLFFAACTFLGEETFLIVAVLAIYWAVDKRRGEYLLLSLYMAIASNGILKDAVRRPRPFLTPGYEDLRYVRIDNPLVSTLDLADSYSFPSGHAQCASGLFSGVWLSGRRRGSTAFLCLLAVALVMTSRVYLGVHFPTDVLAGALLGLLCALLAWVLFRALYSHRLILLGAVVGLSCLALLFMDASPDTVKTTALGAGAFLGMLLEHQAVHFRTQGSVGGKVLRVVLGALLILAVRFGLRLVFPAGLLFDAIRYGAVGLAATGLWPWLFTRMGL